ncbi:hypothetical protein GUJ93_ZPchr0008g13503 [Zizania palustris]|uniref:Uncharacterized protein n=1 Tax=Zizania palustris TaxID=103762 RepID=A0A8J5RJU0_ZIZPA|nr:hypothetical protein GUJ93_ZPchr0008g13503 [Zizania palustris]
MADGGGGEAARRSRSPARVRERPPEEPATGDVAEVEAPPPLPSTDEVRTTRVATRRRSLTGVFLMAPGDETSLPSTSMAASSRTCWWCRVRRQSGAVRRMRGRSSRARLGRSGCAVRRLWDWGIARRGGLRRLRAFRLLAVRCHQQVFRRAGARCKR